MLIGIDASRAVRSNPTGTEYYSWEIIQALLMIDRENSYRLYAPHLPKAGFPEQVNEQWKILPDGRLWSQLKLASELKQNPPDVLFVPAHIVPLRSNLPSVVTIHGLEYKYAPESYRRRERAYLNFSTGVSVAKAKKIIAPSEQTKADIIKFYKTPEEKIIVIPESYDKKRFNLVIDHGERPLKDPYIFYIGRIEQRKNLEMLINAFSLLAKEKGSGRLKLVLAGKSGYGYKDVEAKIKQLPPNLRESVLLPGYLTDAEAARYLKHATVFCYPSLYEGFGIPILEAMGMGVPVIASNTSCLPEVAGDAAVLLPPDQPLSWAGAMSRIIHQDEYAKDLKKKGLNRAKEFSWEKAAHATLNIITDAAKH